MHVMVFGSEALALELESSLKPGIEVVVLGAPIDSPKIGALLIVSSLPQYASGAVAECIANAKGRLSAESLVKIIIV